jgi:hypothetical protein
VATFDETGRQACKVHGPGLTGWVGLFAEESTAADFASWAALVDGGCGIATNRGRVAG